MKQLSSYYLCQYPPLMYYLWVDSKINSPLHTPEYNLLPLSVEWTALLSQFPIFFRLFISINFWIWWIFSLYQCNSPLGRHHYPDYCTGMCCHCKYYFVVCHIVHSNLFCYIIYCKRIVFQSHTEIPSHVMIIPT